LLILLLILVITFLLGLKIGLSSVISFKPLMESGETTLAECRICQEEDNKRNMEIPCVCSGTLKVRGFRRIEKSSLYGVVFCIWLFSIPFIINLLTQYTFFFSVLHSMPTGNA